MTPNLTGQSQGNPSPVYAMLKYGHEGVDSAQPGGQLCFEHVSKSRSGCHGRDPFPPLQLAAPTAGENCVTVYVQTNIGETHRGEYEAVKNHLQLQPHEPGAIYCLAQESASSKFLLPDELA